MHDPHSCSVGPKLHWRLQLGWAMGLLPACHAHKKSWRQLLCFCRSEAEPTKLFDQLF